MKKTIAAAILLLLSIPSFVSAEKPWQVINIDIKADPTTGIVNGQPLTFYTHLDPLYQNRDRYELRVYAYNTVFNYRSALLPSTTTVLKAGNKDNPYQTATEKTTIAAGAFYAPADVFSRGVYPNLANPDDNPYGNGAERAKNFLEADEFDIKTNRVVSRSVVELSSGYQVIGFSPDCFMGRRGGSGISNPWISCSIAESFHPGTMLYYPNTNNASSNVILEPDYTVDVYVQSTLGVLKVATFHPSDFAPLPQDTAHLLYAQIKLAKDLPLKPFNVLAYITVPGKGIVGYGNSIPDRNFYDGLPSQEPGVQMFTDFNDSLPSIVPSNSAPSAPTANPVQATFTRISQAPLDGFGDSAFTSYTLDPHASSQPQVKSEPFKFTQIAEFSITAGDQSYKIPGLSFRTSDYYRYYRQDGTRLSDVAGVSGPFHYFLLDETTGKKWEILYSGDKNNSGILDTGCHLAGSNFEQNSCISTYIPYASSRIRNLNISLAAHETRKFKILVGVETFPFGPKPRGGWGGYLADLPLVESFVKDGLYDVLSLDYVQGLSYDVQGKNPAISGLPMMLSKFTLKNGGSTTTPVSVSTPPDIPSPTNPTTTPVIVPTTPVTPSSTSTPGTGNTTKTPTSNPTLQSVTCQADNASPTLSPTAKVTWSAVTVPADDGTLGYKYLWTGTNPGNSKQNANLIEYKSAGIKAELVYVTQGNKRIAARCPQIKVSRKVSLLDDLGYSSAAVFDSMREYWGELFR